MTIKRKEGPPWRGIEKSGEREIEGERDQCNIEKCISKNNCSSTNPRKDLNKNLFFPAIILYMCCHSCQPPFFNYQTIVLRKKLLALVSHLCKLVVLGLHLSLVLVELGQVVSFVPYNYHFIIIIIIIIMVVRKVLWGTRWFSWHCRQWNQRKKQHIYWVYPWRISIDENVCKLRLKPKNLGYCCLCFFPLVLLFHMHARVFN